MTYTSKLFRVAWRVGAALFISAVQSGAGQAQLHFTTVTGKITWDIPEGVVNIGNAKVQILDRGSSPTARRVSERTTADANKAEYRIHVAEGSHDIVACDDDLIYVPQIKPVNRPEVDFRLKRYSLRVLARPLPVQFAEAKAVVYLKHIETGCEFDAMPSDGKGVVLVPNTIDQATFFSRYDYCVDEKVEDEEDSRSPFESCVNKELPRGLTKKDVEKKLGKNYEKKGNCKREEQECVYVYEYVKVKFVGGKISDVKVEIEPPPCLLGMGCRGN